MVATADLWDERGAELDSLGLQLRDLGGRREFDGPIRTVRCFRDNALIKELLATPGAGAVLVIDGGGSLDSALVGDLIAGSAVDHEWSGLVIFGAVRDSVTLGELPLGIKALGTNPRKSAKDRVGEVDVELSIEGVSFRPGAHLWADPDGVVVER